MQCFNSCKGQTCALECKGVPPGRYNVKLPNTELDRLRGYLDLSHEMGGAMNVDIHNQRLTPGPELKGKRDAVMLPAGMFQWHTHPNQCRKADKCWLDMPSEDDVHLAIEQGFRGVHGQIVVAHSGTYIFCMSGNLRLKSASNPRMAAIKAKRHFGLHMQRFEQRILKAVRKGPSHEREVHAQLRNEWLQVAAKYGLDAKFFPVGRPVYVPVLVVPRPLP